MNESIKVYDFWHIKRHKAITERRC